MTSVFKFEDKNYYICQKKNTEENIHSKCHNDFCNNPICNLNFAVSLNSLQVQSHSNCSHLKLKFSSLVLSKQNLKQLI